MATDDEKIDRLTECFHELDKKLERLITLMEQYAKNDEGLQARVAALEAQVQDNTASMKIVKWAAGSAFTLATLAIGHLLKTGIDAILRLATP